MRSHRSLVSLRSLVPLITWVVAACSTPDRLALPTAPAAARPVAVTPPDEASRLIRLPNHDDMLRAVLERASSGLLYTSESDYPFTWFFSPGPASAPLTPVVMLESIDADPDTPIESITLDQFFARHIERIDPADSASVANLSRYRFLRETLRLTLRNPQVFRVGTVQIQCYIVGTDAFGHIVGLSTVSIET